MTSDRVTRLVELRFLQQRALEQNTDGSDGADSNKEGDK